MPTLDPSPVTNHRVGFVSTRFSGHDGVTLESAKWAEVLWEDRHTSFWYAGLLDRDPNVSMCVPEAHFTHQENEWINARIWGVTHRSRLVTQRIHDMAAYLKATLYEFVERFGIEILIPQNVLTIPMHLPLGVAMAEFLAETQMPTIAHHHDFYWERDRFSINAVTDFLDMAFPHRGQNIRHVVINQQAQEQLSLRKGVSSMLVPNVFAFENSPPPPDEYCADFRQEVGLAEDDIVVLQPTRIVPRKGIENAIRLIGRLKNQKCKLVITHEAGDEGMEYQHLLEELAKEEQVDLRIISDRITDVRRTDQDGRKTYTLWDAYAHANLVTYLSTYEGFGNALLEAFYFRVPVVINRYSIFIQDIEPKGFMLPMMDGFVTTKLIGQIERILEDETFRNQIVESNYQLATQYYGYAPLRRNLQTLIASLPGLS